jgi:KUP system potassium uptake protein
MLLEWSRLSAARPVYPTAQRDVVPAALALNLRHNGVLHELVVVMKVMTERSPRVAETERILVEKLPAGLCDVTLQFGFAEKRMYWPR